MLYPLVNSHENGNLWLIYPFKMLMFRSLLYVYQRVKATNNPGQPSYKATDAVRHHL